MNGESVAEFKTEAQKADDYRAKVAPLLTALAAIMNDAKRDGLQISVNVSIDQYGRFVAMPVNIVKPF